MKIPKFMKQRGARSIELRYVGSDGKRQYETFREATLALSIEKASKELAKRMGDIANDLEVTSEPNTITFATLCKRLIKDNNRIELSSRADVATRINLHILPHFGEIIKAKDVKKDQINGFIDALREEGIGNGGINRKLETIRRVFKLGIEDEKIFKMPKITLLDESAAVREGFFELDQLRAICEFLPKHLIPPVCFGYITGWRHQEIMKLTWSHVYPDGVRLNKTESKNKKGRHFPLVPPLARLLKSIEPAVHSPHTPLFPTPKKSPGNGGAVGRFDDAWGTAVRKSGLTMPDGTPAWRWSPVRKALRDANGEPLRDQYEQLILGPVEKVKQGPNKGKDKVVCRSKLYFHDFRRTAYRNLLRGGTVPSVAQAAVGWKNAMTPIRYDSVSAADLANLEHTFQIGGAFDFWETSSSGGNSTASGGNSATSGGNSALLLPETTDSKWPRGDSDSRPSV